MQKTQILKKNKTISEALSSKKAKYIIGTSLLSVVGIALPKVVHLLAGSNAGAMFLPMHIAVLISALTFGILSSTIVAGTSVFFSYALTGMPTLARLPYMLTELLIYAILLGLFNKKFNSYISLTLTIVLGRIIYALALFVSVNVLGFQSYGVSVMESIKIGSLGIIIQLICVPFIANKINKGLNLKND